MRGMAVVLRRPRLGFGLGPQIVAVLLVVGLACAMAIQPTRQLLEQRSRIAQMSSDLSRMERSNKELDRLITRLEDPDYLEQQAREQIGLVKPGETTFVVMPPKRKRGARGADGPRSEGAARGPRTFLERLYTFVGWG
jgi:cell division protein FtsB